MSFPFRQIRRSGYPANIAASGSSKSTHAMRSAKRVERSRASCRAHRIRRRWMSLSSPAARRQGTTLVDSSSPPGNPDVGEAAH